MDWEDFQKIFISIFVLIIFGMLSSVMIYVFLDVEIMKTILIVLTACLFGAMLLSILVLVWCVKE